MAEIKDNVKQQQLLGAAKKLFWKYGIKRVSVEEICKEAEVSKMTFYRYYSNKKEIARLLLEQVMDNSQKIYDGIVDGDLPFAEKITKIIRLKFEDTKEISQEFVMDLMKDPDLQEMIQQKRQQNLSQFLQFLNEAQQNGEIRSDVKLETVLYFFNKTPELAADPKLHELYDSTQDAMMGLTNFFFYGIGVK